MKDLATGGSLSNHLSKLSTQSQLHGHHNHYQNDQISFTGMASNDSVEIFLMMLSLKQITSDDWWQLSALKYNTEKATKSQKDAM